MIVMSFLSNGFNGELVEVEADMRNGIPGMDIVGLPDNAIKEAKERVRIAIRNSNFDFPQKRIVINLAPAGIKKRGAGFDLALALAIMDSGRLVSIETPYKVMALGELQLNGQVRAVAGVLAAVSTAAEYKEVAAFLVPWECVNEARLLKYGKVYGIGSLKEAVEVLTLLQNGLPQKVDNIPCEPVVKPIQPDQRLTLRFLRGQETLKRSLLIAAAGRHHLLLFGPPGGGKTIAARALPSLLPPLDDRESVEVSKIYSLARQLPCGGHLIRQAPLRLPHHSASEEGLIGGGKNITPGEISLAHNGVLFLDEAPHFHHRVLQALRQPLESRRVDISRAGISGWYPADFQLIMAANPCPCGNLGRDRGVCDCSRKEIGRYWQQLGGALLDRIDMRIPVRPSSSEELLTGSVGDCKTDAKLVARAIARQKERFGNYTAKRNSQIASADIERFCLLQPEANSFLIKAGKKLALSSRACHAVLKVARTVADISEHRLIELEDVQEAIQYRRYGDDAYFWV